MSATGYKTSDGTDLMTVFNNTVITGANTFSNPSNVLYGDGSNLTATTFSNMLTTDTAQTISAAKTFAGATSGIQLSACCMQGRGDSFGFVTKPSGFTKQPLGYTISYVYGPTGLTNVFQNAAGSTFTHTNIPTMDAGVWHVSAENYINYGTATWLSNSTCVLSYSAPVGGTFAGYVPKYNYFSPPNTNLGFEFTPLIFTATDPNGNSQVKPTTYMTYSAAPASTTYTFYLTATKIA